MTAITVTVVNDLFWICFQVVKIDHLPDHMVTYLQILVLFMLWDILGLWDFVVFVSGQHMKHRGISNVKLQPHGRT